MRIFILALALFCSTISYRQMAILDTAWEATQQMARKADKPIFVDADTQWCGPSLILYSIS